VAAGEHKQVPVNETRNAWLSHGILMTRMPRVANGLEQHDAIVPETVSDSESHEACIACVFMCRQCANPDDLDTLSRCLITGTVQSG
jgi:hypothetical protein